MHKLILGAAAALISTQAPAQPANPPRLMIAISVDQLSADIFDEYRSRFTGGFARLSRGAMFRNGYQSHATTETCLGHSTILTGDRPARTGIVGNVWFGANAPRSDKSVYCAEDETVPGSNSSDYTVSPMHLRVPTLGDLLKKASPKSVNVAVAGKDRSAVMMGGRAVDQRWYPDGTRFVTDLKGAPVPKSVVRANAEVARLLASPGKPFDPPPFCAAKATPYPMVRGGKPVGDGRFDRAAGQTAAFKPSPEFDAVTLALSAALIQEMGLGRDSAPDVLSIGLAGTDYVGHTYGPGGQEMCIQLLSLDRDLGDFFSRLDSWGIDYAVVLTADHGGLDIPERLQAKGVAGAAWIDLALMPDRLGREVAASANVNGPVIVFGGPSGDIYLDPKLSAAGRKRATAALLAAYRAHPQVETVFTKEEIARAARPAGNPVQWPLLQRVRASFDPERSGDLYVVLKPHIQPIADTTRYVSTHGSPWDYDRRVPVLFWRRGMATAAIETPVETADIMPTLAAMIGLPIDSAAIDGKCLQAVPGVSCPTP